MFKSDRFLALVNQVRIFHLAIHINQNYLKKQRQYQQLIMTGKVED